MLRGIVGSLSTELGSLEPAGVRGTKALGAALSVALAVFAALFLHSDEPWWAAISAWMMTGISLAEALPRAIMRIIGSTAGAALAVIILGLFAYDPLLFCLCLFAMTWAGLFGFGKSPHGYAWLMAAITGNLVMLIALDQPQMSFTIAVNRAADVTIGTGATLLVTYLLPALPRPPGTPPATSTNPLPLLFWSRRHAREFDQWLHENWLLILHACRGGLAVMVLPLLLNWLAPLGSSQLAVTSVAIMAIPTTAVAEPDGRTVIQRAVHRLVGCALGALLGLFVLHGVGENFFVWLLLLMAGLWLASQIQSGNTGVGYIGTQAGIAFILSMIQGQGPPVSIIPGIDRFAGIMAGLSVLLIITMAMSLFRIAPRVTPVREG
jgi:uncharacterized membrane protein YgaE (UPF0421/DUF939 family)